MIKSLPRPFLALGALVVALPLGGCVAATIGSIAASALLSAGTGGPAQAPTVAEQLANSDARVLDSCRAQLDRLRPPAPGDGAASPAAVAAHPHAEASVAPPAPRCAVQPVCLPGHSQPTAMMVCQSPFTPESGVIEMDRDPGPRRYDAWHWDQVEEPAARTGAGAQPDTRGASAG